MSIFLTERQRYIGENNEKTRLYKNHSGGWYDRAGRPGLRGKETDGTAFRARFRYPSLCQAASRSSISLENGCRIETSHRRPPECRKHPGERADRQNFIRRVSAQHTRYIFCQHAEVQSPWYGHYRSHQKYPGDDRQTVSPDVHSLRSGPHPRRQRIQ